MSGSTQLAHKTRNQKAAHQTKAKRVQLLWEQISKTLQGGGLFALVSEKNRDFSWKLTPSMRYFYNSAISKHVVRPRIVVEMGSRPTKMVLFNHTTPFSTKGLEKSLCDFTGTVFVQCENPVLVSGCCVSQKHGCQVYKTARLL